MRKYALCSETTGIYKYYDTLDEAIAAYTQEVLAKHAERIPLSVVDIDVNGIETWKNADQEITPNYVELSDLGNKINQRYNWV